MNDVWALDTETFLFFPGYLAPEIVCMSWAHAEDSDLCHGRDPDLSEALFELLGNRHTVYANAPYDLAVFGAKWPTLVPVIFEALDEGRVHDIQTREKLIDLAHGTFRFEEDEDGEVRAKGYSLAELAWRRLRVRMDKDTWRMRYHELWNVEISEWPQGAVSYATQDAKATLQIFNLQETARARTPSFDQLGDESAQCRAHWALHLMSTWGVKTDQDAVRRLERRVLDQIDEIREELETSGLVRADGTRDTKAAVRRMVECMGLDSLLTDGGIALLEELPLHSVIEKAKDEGKFVSVSESSAALSGDTTLMKYSRYVRLRNLLKGSIKDLSMGTVTPIQTQYELLQATGRTSSSSPNIQNLRREPGVRECFVPRDGCVIIACDYSQAELHTWAQVCYSMFGESDLRTALNSGIDVHAHLASKVVGVEYETLNAQVQAGDAEAKIARRIAKHGNFAFMGGASAKRFRSMVYALTQGELELDMRHAAKVRETWYRTWREAPRYFKHVRECSHGDNKYWVKQHGVERLRTNCTYTSAANSPFQGLASDGAKAALYEVTREQFIGDSPLLGTACLAFIHDEILIEAPEESAHAAAMRLKCVMEREFNRFVPDCPTTAEPVVMRRWSKKATQTYDGTRLVPWEG